MLKKKLYILQLWTVQAFLFLSSQSSLIGGEVLYKISIFEGKGSGKGGNTIYHALPGESDINTILP